MGDHSVIWQCGWQWGPTVGSGGGVAGSGGSQRELALNRTNPLMPTTTSPRPNRLPNFGGPSLDSAKTTKTPEMGYLLAEVMKYNIGIREVTQSFLVPWHCHVQNAPRPLPPTANRYWHSVTVPNPRPPTVSHTVSPTANSGSVLPHCEPHCQLPHCVGGTGARSVGFGSVSAGHGLAWGGRATASRHCPRGKPEP